MMTKRHLYQKSHAWDALNGLVMGEIYKAPLALSIIDANTVTKIIRSSDCRSCQRKSSDVIMATVSRIRQEMDTVAIEVCVIDPL